MARITLAMTKRSVASLALCLLIVIQRNKTALGYISTKDAYLFDLCSNEDPICSELEADEWCSHREEQQRERYDKNVCPSIDTTTSTFNRDCTYEHYRSSGSDLTVTASLLKNHPELCQLPPSDCQSVSERNWPQFNYSLVFVNTRVFNVSINWEPADVAGYSLIVSLSPWTGCLNNPTVQCAVTTLQQDNTEFLYTHLMGYHKGIASKEMVYIKLIPRGWCDGPQVTVHVPESCHNLCPGACDVCGSVNEVAPPTNLSVSLCWSPVTDIGVASVAWQPGEIYYRPYVNQTYYVSVWNGSKTLPIFETNAVSRHLEVVGKTSVVLHNLSLIPGQPYHIRVWQYDCKCSLTNAGLVELIMDQDTPLCEMPALLKTSSLSATTQHATFQSTAVPSVPPSTIHNTLTVSATITYNSTALPTASTVLVSTYSSTALPKASTVSTYNSTTLPKASTVSTYNSTALPKASTVSTYNSTALPKASTVSTYNSTALPKASSLTGDIVHSTATHVRVLSYSTAPLTPTPSPTTVAAPGSSSGQWHLTYVLIPVVLVCSITLILLIIIVCYSQRHRSTSTAIASSNSKLVESGFKVQDAPEVKPKVNKVKVLVVYSLETPSDDIECILENFVKPLHMYGVDAVFYDMSHGRGGIPQWVECSVAESSKVFLVCNKQFKTEWEQSNSGPLVGNVVHVVKQNFLAHVVSSSEYSTKFSLLFLRTKCFETCMPSKYLYNLQRFVVDPNDELVLEQVVRYILNVKSYALPPD